MTVPLMLLADERPGLEARVREATGERVVWQVLPAELGALPIDGLLAIGVESSGGPRLKRLLGAAIERLDDEHCALLIWTGGPKSRPPNAARKHPPDRSLPSR